MNLESLKTDFIDDLHKNTDSYSSIKDIFTAFVAGVNHGNAQNVELMSVLKQVKSLMDSEVFLDDFDDVYSNVSSVIEKYDGKF
ncbi:MAG: hypothetical protein ACLVKO_09005 [Dysgonomonas sp.]